MPADRVVGRHPEEDGLALGAAREEELDVRRSGFGLHGTEREVRGDGDGLGVHRELSSVASTARTASSHAFATCGVRSRIVSKGGMGLPSQVLPPVDAP